MLEIYFLGMFRRSDVLYGNRIGYFPDAWWQYLFADMLAPLPRIRLNLATHLIRAFPGSNLDRDAPAVPAAPLLPIGPCVRVGCKQPSYALQCKHTHRKRNE